MAVRGRARAVSGAGSPRRELGRRLAGARKAAGYTQEQLAVAIGYSRSTVSNAEIGHPDIALAFWARCDRALKIGRSFGQVRAAERHQTAGVPEDAGLPDAMPSIAPGVIRRARQQISSGQAAETLAAYRELGWAVQPGGGGLELVTGDGLEALELSRAAGWAVQPRGGGLEPVTGDGPEALELPRAARRLAVSLWPVFAGRPDEIRRLPVLAHPAQALAVITAGTAISWPRPVAACESGANRPPGAGRRPVRSKARTHVGRSGWLMAYAAQYPRAAGLGGVILPGAPLLHGD